jgi:hypothetical protein
MVSSFTQKKLTAKERKEHKDFRRANLSERGCVEDQPQRFLRAAADAARTAALRQPKFFADFALRCGNNSGTWRNQIGNLQSTIGN